VSPLWGAVHRFQLECRVQGWTYSTTFTSSVGRRAQHGRIGPGNLMPPRARLDARGTDTGGADPDTPLPDLPIQEGRDLPARPDRQACCQSVSNADWEAS